MKRILSFLLVIFVLNITLSFAAESAFLINNDDKETRTTTVELTINYTEGERMRFANDGMYNWSEWESFSSKKSWELSAGEGSKVVYIEIEDKGGKTSIYSDSISFERYPRGTITLRWEYVQASVGGYAIYLWDGYAYREIDRLPQDVLEWNSDEARIYPKEEVLAKYEDNSVTQNLFTAKGKGERLRNNPNGLYRVMKDGIAHSYEEYKDHYLFKIGTINEYGEVVLSAPITTRMENWEEGANLPPEVGVTINNGDEKTFDKVVELKIEANDDLTPENDLLMRFANDKKQNWSSWEKFSTTKKWELSEGYGEKIVFVEVKDAVGDKGIASDRILLEELKVEMIDFTLATNNGAHATKEDKVTLEIKEVEDLSGYNCVYIIDEIEKRIEINSENKIVLPLEKNNKNNFTIKLESKDGTKVGEKEIIIWKL